MLEAQNKTNPTLIKLSLKDVESFLYFPSGLSVEKAKDRAKAISKAQDIKLSQAQLMVAWSHGCPSAKSWTQALEDILKNQWDWELNKTIQLFQEESEGLPKIGIRYKDGEKLAVIKTTFRPGKDTTMIGRAFEFRKQKIEQDKGLFIESLKAALKRLPEIYYTLSVPSIDDMKSKWDCDINLERIVEGCGCSHGMQILAEFVGSMYNGRAYGKLLFDRAIRLAKDYGVQIDLPESVLEEIRYYCTPEVAADELCGVLDADSKKIVKGFIDSYSGW